MNKLIIALILLFFFLGQSVRGQEDNIKVSLMTCAPGTEIYALFGHTALRYEDKARGEDWVFNYGMFSFNTPHFIYRFVNRRIGFNVKINYIRTRLDKIVNIFKRLAYHQVTVEYLVAALSYALYNRCTEGKVRYKMAVHNINMNPVCTAGIHASGFLPHF